MANRVYWKSLRLVLGSVERYIERWDSKLEANLTTEQFNCVQDVLTAVRSCLLLLPQNTPGS